MPLSPTSRYLPGFLDGGTNPPITGWLWGDYDYSGSVDVANDFA